MENKPKYKIGDSVKVNSGDYSFVGVILNIDTDVDHYIYLLYNPELGKKEWFHEHELNQKSLFEDTLGFAQYMVKLKRERYFKTEILCSLPERQLANGLNLDCIFVDEAKNL